MIKIERVSPKAVVKVNGLNVGIGYAFEEEFLDTLQVSNGEVLYSVHEKSLKYKWSPGCEYASRGVAANVLEKTTKEIKVAAPAAVVEKDSAKPIEVFEEVAVAETDVGSVEDVLLEEGYSAPKNNLRQPPIPRKAIPGK